MARRRKRSRSRRKATALKAAAERDHMARVHVSDAVWAEFRAAAATPLNLRLGELVTREVDRDRSRRLREGHLDDAELLEALERAQELHADLAALVTRLERRLERVGSPQPDSPDRTSFGLD